MAYHFGDDLKNEIINANDISDVVGEYVSLKRTGRNLLGLCPFHGEKTPSFTVSPEKQFYKCFGCGVGGNVVDFVMRIEHLDFQEAMISLAERAHISLERARVGSSAPSVPKTDKERTYSINTEAARFFNRRLSSAPEAVSYIKERELKDSTVTRFGLGFAPDSWNALINHMKPLGFTEEELYKAGLAGKKDNRYYDSFRNRIIFPIIDLRGRVVGFGGRVMDDSKPKYLNSPETPVFDKSRNFYGLNFAKADNHKTAVVVEGYMDVIALHQAGITNAVATLGTSFTVEHAKILKRYFDDVVLAFDSDGAGRSATERCIGIINQAGGIKTRVLTQNQAKDPDEYLKKFGRDAFLGLIKNAPGQIEYRVSGLRENADLSDVEQKVKFVTASAQIFAEIKNDIEQEAYVKKIARESGISEEAVFSEIKRITGRGGKDALKVMTYRNREKSLSRAEKAEEMLLTLLYGDKKLYERVSAIIAPSFFTSAVNGEIFELLGKHDDLSVVFDSLSEEQRAVAGSIAVKDFHIDDKEKGAAELIEKISAEKNRQELERNLDDAEMLRELLLRDKRSIKGIN